MILIPVLFYLNFALAKEIKLNSFIGSPVINYGLMDKSLEFKSWEKKKKLIHYIKEFLFYEIEDTPLFA